MTTKNNWRTIAEQEHSAMNDARRRYDLSMKDLASVMDQINNGTPEERFFLLSDLFYYGFAQGRKAERAKLRG